MSSKLHRMVKPNSSASMDVPQCHVRRALPWVLWSVFAVCHGCSDPSADDLCHPTSRNCPCSAAGTCIEGLACVDNLCLEPDEWTVFLSSTEARSCDLLLDADEGTRVSGVAYGTGVRGHFEQRGRLTGVAMISTTSAAMPKEPLRVQGFGEPPRIREARCAGGRGQPLADATFSIP